MIRSNEVKHFQGADPVETFKSQNTIISTMAVECVRIVIDNNIYNAKRYVDEKMNVTIAFPYKNDQQLLSIIKAYAGHDTILTSETVVVKFY